jgi:hypothetical protein
MEGQAGAALIMSAESDTAVGTTPTQWAVDSGADFHFCRDRTLFTTLTPAQGRMVKVGDGRPLPILGAGTVRCLLVGKQGQKPTPITLQNVQYAPGLAFNLLSVPSVDDSGLFVTFGGGRCVVNNSLGQEVASTPLIGRQYRLTTLGRDEPVSGKDRVILAASAHPDDRLGLAQPPRPCRWQQFVSYCSRGWYRRGCHKSARIRATSSRTCGLRGLYHQ